MNGYSKMKMISKPRSTDMISDLLTLATFQNPHSPKIQSQHQKITSQINYTTAAKNAAVDSSSSEQEDDDCNTVGGGGERMGARLSRNSSVSSAYALQSAVKRAFSMRRSSSVSERYCRIHDQSVTLASPLDDEEEVTAETAGAGSGKTKNKKKKNKNEKKKKKNDIGRDKILKACKRLFGF